MKPIQTRYKGYHFRSRLEARWAVFFDSLDIPWEYEPEGYDLGAAGLYLPDFYLPTIGSNGLWVEIKATAPTTDETRKLEALVAMSGRPGTFRVGEPFINVQLAARGDSEHTDGSSHLDNAWIYLGANRADGPYLFCVCPWCRKVGFEFDGRGARVCTYKKHYADEQTASVALIGTRYEGQRVDDKCYSGGHTKIRNAALAARSARFEHQQSGAT